MSRRIPSQPVPPWEADFTIVCTGGGSHRPVKLGRFSDLRDGFPVGLPEPEDLEEGQDYDEVVAKIEEDSRGIYASGVKPREPFYPHALTSPVFEEKPDGSSKYRLKCPRCRRDVQFSDERFERLADAIKAMQGDSPNYTVDISKITG